MSTKIILANVAMWVILVCPVLANAQARGNDITRDEEEAPAVGMAELLESCLQATDDFHGPHNRHDCIGIHARPCIQRDGNDTTVGMMECYIQEYQGWDLLLNRYYHMAQEGAPPQNPLRDVQRAWLRYRDIQCGYYDVHYAGGSMARWMAARCMMIETARRTIDLTIFVPDWR